MADEFGRVLTAMVTPFSASGDVDAAAVAEVAKFLTRPGWNDGLVVNGTTGESATTSDREKAVVIEVVRETVGDLPVVAGVGTADTAHSVQLARQAKAAGASGLLVVSPYYVRPTQEGLKAHVLAIAEATDLPIMLYDIPHRTGVEFGDDLLVELSSHPMIRAVKDATGNLVKAARVMEASGLAWYSGDDALNLAFAAIGARGFVSVVGHLGAHRLRAVLDAVDAGDLARAREEQSLVSRATEIVFRLPGAVSAKAALVMAGIATGQPRLPLAPAGEQAQAALAEAWRLLN